MAQELADTIRNVKDFPKPGIVFRDITTLLKDQGAFKKTGEELLRFAKNVKVDKVAGIESRGFIFGAYLAEKLGVGFIPLRKPGKLPAETIKEEYELEYGSDAIEIHKDAITPGEKILLHDDLLATGGTAEAACKLIEKAGGEIAQISFIIDLAFLNGREKLKKYDVRYLVTYDSE